MPVLGPANRRVAKIAPSVFMSIPPDLTSILNYFLGKTSIGILELKATSAALLDKKRLSNQPLF